MFKSYFFTLILALLHAGLNAQSGVWRSHLFPENWTPGLSDEEGRFLHDFSYAGYHSGEKPIPTIKGPVFNAVEQFGADNTGVEDSTVSVQATIDAAEAAGGGVVYLPEGHYYFSSGLNVNRDGVVIRGNGVGKTRLQFVDEAEKRVTAIRFAGENKTDVSKLLVKDTPRLSKDVWVENASDLKVGDDVDVGWIISDEFIEEHGMTGVWKPHNGKWMTFFQANVEAVDTSSEPHKVTLDTPVRYPIKVRDMASIKRRTHLLEECGVEDLSITNAMREGVVETLSQDVRRELIRFIDAKNCWTRNVESMLPIGEGYDAKYQVYDKGIVVIRCKRITLQDCGFYYAQRRDGGGHGYLYVVEGGNDVLTVDCKGIGGRHNYTASWLFGNVGNVYLRCESTGGSLSDFNNNLGPSDFHHSLAIANLVDSCVINDGWHGMNRGEKSGGAGHTVTESVYWNCSGDGEIRSAQYGWGYLIGLSDSLRTYTKVDLDKPRLDWLEAQYQGTLPWDYVEGSGEWERLYPQSLYEEQLKLRLNQGKVAVQADLKLRSKNVATPTMDSAPDVEPTLTIAESANSKNEDSEGGDSVFIYFGGLIVLVGLVAVFGSRKIKLSGK
ncbi:glycosyl hydrolase family 28-related protein [Cerasicoccus frondis]|uniref:glycosyl hydrolase family 28-related protein n=1 Tax=Cerasicoccus frondis TaxID=490090 RepID=UPI0028529B14|nr:glycosyl hydrolase family 28-related protein [Cerasicoccus frondis]